MRVRSLLGTGALRIALAEEAATGAYDLAVMAAPARRRLARACAAPLLVIPAASTNHRREVPQMIQRGVIVARIKPGAQEQVAELFAESDGSELPALAGVRHRSLFALGDVYVHLVELEGDLEGAVARVREHPLFRELSAKLDAYIEPYDPRRGARPRTPWRRSSTAGTPKRVRPRGA